MFYYQQPPSRHLFSPGLVLNFVVDEPFLYTMLGKGGKHGCKCKQMRKWTKTDTRRMQLLWAVHTMWNPRNDQHSFYFYGLAHQQAQTHLTRWSIIKLHKNLIVPLLCIQYNIIIFSIPAVRIELSQKKFVLLSGSSSWETEIAEWCYSTTIAA